MTNEAQRNEDTVDPLVLPDSFGATINVEDEIKRLVNMAFFTGQRAQQEPLESFAHLAYQRDWLLDILRQNAPVVGRERSERTHQQEVRQ